jgi:PAS domain S-box-containing protein
VNTVERIADEVLATLVESADDAVIVADASGAIRYWNSAIGCQCPLSPA